MTNDSLKEEVLREICSLKRLGYHIVIVHGGGPFIQEALDLASIESEFIDGHRKTTKEALSHVEMALKGKVNGSIVSLINRMGFRAVGLSGKDGRTVLAKKRLHIREVDGKEQQVDLGQVGDVVSIQPDLIHSLINDNFIPVLTCIAMDEEGEEYNINADLFAGHLAGALQVEEFVVLTDVDGLFMDRHRPETLISHLNAEKAEELRREGIIAGGMIPKIESCLTAVENGAKQARILNGTKPEQIREFINKNTLGTSVGK